MAVVEVATLTPEQRRIVEYGEGPLVVIAGAGTGKTRVIVERVRWLLDAKGDGTLDAHGRLLAAEPITAPETAAEQPEPPSALGLWDSPPAAPDRDRPFDGPLVPEQVLVLTYNVKAAKELQARLDDAVGPATRSRMTVSRTSTASATGC